MTTQTIAPIASVSGRWILDSRGRPTVEAEVTLEDGTKSRASAPSGASTGTYEARELRDHDPARHEGRGVLRAVGNINGEIASALCGKSVLQQRQLDTVMRELDGTPNLERLGANAVLAVSLALARTAAAFLREPLYRYLSRLSGECGNVHHQPSLPMPMVNILSGGAHAGRGMDFQDFLAMPVGARDYSEALEWVLRVRASATRLMQEEGLTTLLADEGGLSPGFICAEQALELMMRSFDAAGLRAGDEMAIAIDVAASELHADSRYVLKREGRTLSGDEMAAYAVGLCRRYPVVSIEDPLDEDDWTHWAALTRDAKDRNDSEIQVVGDDLFVTNPSRIARGIESRSANAVLIKLNQNGTLTGTLEALALARSAGFAAVVSARSGETEDPFIADLAVGCGAGQIKVGSVRNSERQAKYNQLLRIEQEGNLPFAGVTGLAGRGVRIGCER